MRFRFPHALSSFALLAGAFLVTASASSQRTGVDPARVPAVSELQGWELQDVVHVPESGTAVSAAHFKTDGWYKATVPGTVLTTLVNNHIYAEPLYGENSRPESIPESLARTSYWYRTEVTVPAGYAGKHVWLNFDGINYSAAVWVNGVRVGTMRGAFSRGKFDVSANVKPGSKAVVAVLVTPEPHPGTPHEHTLKAGVGPNGGVTASDGPTFLDTIGWDWIPAIRDRDTGIWQKVFFSATGPVLLKDPLVTTDLPLPRTDSTDIGVQAMVENVSDETQTGVLKGRIGTIAFAKTIELAPHTSQKVSFDAKDTAVLHVEKPKLWWPNGYGLQNMYKLQLQFEQHQRVSDSLEVPFGVRKISYSVPDTDNLTISVNGVRVFIRGGDWGMDEGMKRLSHERLEAQIKLHQAANLNLIRNWVGQSTSEDFYELCDKYGLLLWDEFFQPNPSDGPNPDDFDTYMANVREKILRYRNHPSIMLWCARNEGYPPPQIDAALRILMAELEPTRAYQPSSTDGRGVTSHGPYRWREPREFFKVDKPFKTETGSMSIPTIESIHGMMPQKDWEVINDDWAQHDFAKGAASGQTFPGVLAARYGKIANLADFVRKSQLANFEAWRAMYEGRNAQLFQPTTAVIAWMSNPAQPSFVWQIYHYDLDPHSSFFGVKSASEMAHIQFNDVTNEVQVINNYAEAINGGVAHLVVYNLDGTIASQSRYDVTAAADRATSLGVVEFPVTISAVHFLKLDLEDAHGKLLSRNFYWHALAKQQDNFTSLNEMQKVKLNATVTRRDVAGKRLVRVTLKNPTASIALMAHIQLRRSSGDRVLPVFYDDNYVSLAPGESRTITAEADLKEFLGESALVTVDGWNVTVAETNESGTTIKTNVDAQVDHWPVTGLPFATEGLR